MLCALWVIANDFFVVAKVEMKNNVDSEVVPFTKSVLILIPLK